MEEGMLSDILLGNLRIYFRYAVVISAILFLIWFSGCGGSGDQSSSPQDAQDELVPIPENADGVGSQEDPNFPAPNAENECDHLANGPGPKIKFFTFMG